MKTRREFIKVAGTAIGGMVLIPEFLKAIPLSTKERLQGYENANEIVVVIQLSGGNDGLNTFIPFGNSDYYSLRKNIAIPTDSTLKINDVMGWHYSMRGFYDIMQEGNLSVVQNVGYPNPDRSHFRSMEIWQTASDTSEYLDTGWLGRYLDASCKENQVLGGLNLDNIDALAMQGKNLHNIALQNPDQFEKQIKGMNVISDTGIKNDNLAYVRKLSFSAFEGADQIRKALNKTSQYTKDSYPDNALGKNLYWMSRMIKGNLNTKVYYTSFGGFDTHADQLGIQKNRLEQLSTSVKAFYDDMKASGLMNNVTVLVFSEFGRRVIPNGSNGTDHGKAAPVFIIGGNNTGKIIGSNPNLSNLNEGDLQFEYDFRRVYSSILKNKLQADLTTVGLDKYKTLEIFR
jgi:uncharacterized protein (DUF1501 family)